MLGIGFLHNRQQGKKFPPGKEVIVVLNGISFIVLTKVLSPYRILFEFVNETKGSSFRIEFLHDAHNGRFMLVDIGLIFIITYFTI